MKGLPPEAWLPEDLDLDWDLLLFSDLEIRGEL